jgi:hypothetical protein
MSILGDFAMSAPVSIATFVVALRYGPTAAVTLLAGAVAALTRHTRRGERAVVVLHLLHCARQQDRDTRVSDSLRSMLIPAKK